MAEFLNADAEFTCCHGETFQVKSPAGGIVRLGGAPILTLSGLLGATVRDSKCPVADAPPATIACRVVTAVLAGFIPVTQLDGSPLLTTEAMGFTSGWPPIPWRVKKPGQKIAQWSLGIAEAIALPKPTPVLGPHWVDVKLTYEDGGPAVDEEFQIILADGQVISGRLDETGCARVFGLPNGQYKVKFPNLDGRSWRPA